MDYDIRFIITTINVHVWCNQVTNNYTCNEYYTLQKRVVPFGNLDLMCLKGGAAFSERSWVG